MRGRGAPCLLLALAGCATGRTAAPAAPPVEVAAGDPAAAPAAVVDALTRAFNARDLARFGAYFADSLEVIDLPSGRVELRGREAFVASHAPGFRTRPAARVTLLQRIAQGAFVIDRERVQREPADTGTVATVMLEVRVGRVRRLWVLPD